ncbi:MAG: class I SAM-dependent RNA methyltransferase [Anaerolineae bacterium]|jgi:23S rRNA (uracil1939-C5)-methyltransferase
MTLNSSRENLLLDLTDMAHGGDAIARHEGQVVFVRGGIPGERVRAQITERLARFLRATVVDVLEPSPHRRTPPCPYADTCGGCQWQHIAYSAQAVLKTKIVEETLARIGALPDPPVYPILPATTPLAYRNHLQVRFAGTARLGLLARESHRVVPIERCLLAHPLLQAPWDALREANLRFRRASLRVGANTGESLVVVEGSPRAPTTKLPVDAYAWVQGDAVHTVQGDPWYHEQLMDRHYRVSAGSFFQVHTAQAETLVRVALEMLAPSPTDRVLDLYSGVGVFALSIADRVSEVLGIESEGSAVADARVNAAGQTNLRWLEGPAEEALAGVSGRWTKAILDPPRAGCAEPVLQALSALELERIVYVSCEPSTLARDIARLGSLGYAVERIQPVDMFPQTYHVETVALLTR